MGKAQQAFAFQSSFGLALHLGSEIFAIPGLDAWNGKMV
jgi:hypothetical protein